MLSIVSIVLSVVRDGYRSHTVRYNVNTRKRILSKSKVQKHIEKDNQTGFPNAEFDFPIQCHSPRSVSSESYIAGLCVHEGTAGV